MNDPTFSHVTRHLLLAKIHAIHANVRFCQKAGINFNLTRLRLSGFSCEVPLSITAPRFDRREVHQRVMMFKVCNLPLDSP